MQETKMLFAISLSLMLLFAASFSACSDSDGNSDPSTDGDGELGDSEFPQPGGYFACPIDPQATGERPEHPRPDFCRQSWKNLNGDWQFAFDPQQQGEAQDWVNDASAFPMSIRVPFSWQSALSGIEEPDILGAAWYRRNFTVPDEWDGQRIDLVFGAVDWEATVWINGQEACSHEGGYTPFRCDITEFVEDESNELVLRAYDPGADAEVPHGKQGIPWYTNVGGIWQTVYLEPRPEIAIQWLDFKSPVTFDADALALELQLLVTGNVSENVELALVRDGEQDPVALRDLAREKTDAGIMLTAMLDVDENWLWSPEKPNLVPLTVYACDEKDCDGVSSYAAVRVVERRSLSGIDNPVIHVNGKPQFIRTPLVQGYHPEGLMTYPSEQVIIDDLSAAKEMGFNAVRLHIKPEEPLVLYHCDRLGLLVDYDMVNLGVFPTEAGDTEVGRKRWEDTAREQMLRDRHHPSIIWWTLFNETWGLTNVLQGYGEERQQWVLEQLNWVREMDRDSLMEDMSPTQVAMDHVETDLLSWHFYIGDYNTAVEHLDEVVAGAKVGSDYFYTGGRTQPEALPLINTEFGPFSYEPVTPAWKRDRDISDSFRWLVQELRARPEISGYVFTELYDVEFEHNGLMNYDRSEKESGYQDLMGCGISGLQQDVFIGVQEAPSVSVDQGSMLTVHPWVSTYQPENLPAQAEWELVRFDPANQEYVSIENGNVDISASQVGRTDLQVLSIQLPSDKGPFVLRLKAGDACNYVPIIIDTENFTGWTQEGNSSLYSVDLETVAATSTGENFEEDLIEAAGTIVAAGLVGGGSLTTEIGTENLPDTAWSKLSISFEGAANQKGMPQTDAEAFPSTIEVFIDEISLGTIRFADDWADARGILSHHRLSRSGPSGGYGNWVELEVSGEKLNQLKAASQDGVWRLVWETEGEGGVMLYGAQSGRIAAPPQVVVESMP